MPDNRDTVTMVAVGDVAPRTDGTDERFDLTRSILKGADITLGQLETPLSNRGTRQLFSGMGRRGEAPKDPRVGAEVLVKAGFNVMSFASNHTLDYSEESMFDTIEAVTKRDILLTGAGKNIAEARKPAIIERKGTKVGFLAYCSVTPRGYEAREDKPGLAPLRATTSYEQWDWQPGAPPRIITKTNPEDLSAMVEDIKKLRPLVDVLAVSMHWGVHFDPARIAMYQHEAGHAAVDAGADIILGHHAHILKGIEVYKGKVIFFSLCNFILSIQRAMMLNTDHYAFYNFDMDPEYPNYGQPVDSKKTVIVKCEIANKKLHRVAFLPCWINKQVQPEPLSASDPRSDEVYRYMQWLCQNQRLNTRFTRDGDEIVVLT